MSDYISRQDAIDAVLELDTSHRVSWKDAVIDTIDALPSAQKEIIYCKDCRWWDKEAEDSRMGYCHACKHGHYSRHWEIRIIRTYEENFFCADAEPKEEGEENE